MRVRSSSTFLAFGVAVALTLAARAPVYASTRGSDGDHGR
jgi:hypothetical protein